jgi:hypothetical protein
MSYPIVVQPTSQPVQQPVSQNKRERFQLNHDRSVPLFKRAQNVGVGTKGIESFIFRNVRPLEKIVSLGCFFHVVVSDNTENHVFVREIEEMEGPCEPANLDETVAFFGACPEHYGFNRVACINVDVDKSGPGLGRVIPPFVFLRKEFSPNPKGYKVNTTVSEPDSRLLKKGDVIVFRVIVEN